MVWLLAIGGMILGGSLYGIFGMLFGSITGYLIGRVNALDSQLTTLQKRLDSMVSEPLQKQPAPPQQTTAAEPEISPGPTNMPVADIPEPDQALPVADSSAPLTRAVPEPPQDDWTHTPEPRHKDTSPSIAARCFNWFTQGNPVVRIGIVILFFGVSFLVKYAAEQNVLPIELRLCAVALAAVAMLVTGWRLRNRSGAYGLVLQGGAVAVLYLTVFSAIKLYHLLPAGFAFALMIALVAFSGVLAVLQNARTLALFGAAGGFITPILLASGGGSHVMLFSYYALLNAGIFGIAWFKSWRILNVVGFIFTFVIGAAWGHNSYQPAYFSSAEPFLILFFLFYVAIAVLFAHRQPAQLKGYIDGSLVFGVPLVGFTLQSALVKDMEYGMAFSALALSALYILLARSLWKRQIDGMRMLTEAFLALGIIFGSLAVPLALDGRWTAVTWSMEGAALVWVGIHQHRRLARWFGLLLQFGAGTAFLISLDPVTEPFAVLNGTFLGGLVISLTGLFSSWQLQRYTDKLLKFEYPLALLVLAWGLLWWCGNGLRELDLHVDNTYRLYGVLSFSVLSTLLAGWSGQRLNWPWLQRVTLALLPVALLIALLALSQTQQQHPAQHGGWWAWPLALGTHIWILQRYTHTWPKGLEMFWHAGGFLLLVLLLTWQSAWGLDQMTAGGQAWPQLAWGAVPALALLFMLKSGQRCLALIRKFPDAYLGRGLLPLTAWIWLWLLYTCILDGDPSPLTYLPIINPLDLAQVLGIYTLIQWWRTQRANLAQQVSELAVLIPAAIALSAFAWLNALVARTVHFWTPVPFTLSALHYSVVYQASVSILWSVTALAVMVFSSRKGGRTIWFIGVTLLALVVLKLFLVDLSGSGSVARIVSFMAVGGFMLVIGYFSPLPPRKISMEST
ncbi:hypothetical protein MNBD_GAMMA13-1116 [hydrothermal vent metagenome]|uniref:DUF2339 domain-containing protein n=1 Tax=hydrothermal vent metagenome TaxID=652676 RepID=A0A3B0ZL00_9ZZZZ